MKNFKHILSSARDTEPTARDNTRQHLGFAGISRSSGTTPAWSQTPNVALPSVPGPLSAQPQRPLNHDPYFFIYKTSQKIMVAVNS